MGKQNTANKQLLDELECVQQRIIELARAEAECKKNSRNFAGEQETVCPGLQGIGEEKESWEKS